MRLNTFTLLGAITTMTHLQKVSIIPSGFDHLILFSKSTRVEDLVTVVTLDVLWSLQEVRPREDFLGNKGQNPEAYGLFCLLLCLMDP